MRNRFLISAATIGLIAGAGFANAQGTGMGRESGGAAAQQSTPQGGNSAASSNREAKEPSSGMKSTQSEGKSDMKSSQSEEKSGMKSTQKEDKSGTKSTQSEEKSGAAKGKSAEETTPIPGQKSKSMSSENVAKGKDMKAEGREGRKDNTKAEGRDRDQNAAQDREGRDRDQNAAQTTTGQAGAAAKLSTEQRTKITTVIRNEHVAPVNNVDFSISVGTRVPRERISLRPLPSEVVTIYPEWRGYEFFLVSDEIVVVDPRTQEIVAVLPA
jgi:hypothetical protein